MRATVETICQALSEVVKLPDDRPAGYYTVREIGEALVTIGVSATRLAGEQRAFRMIDDIESQGGKPLPYIIVVTQRRPGGRRNPARAFKLIDVPKGKRR